MVTDCYGGEECSFKVYQLTFNKQTHVHVNKKYNFGETWKPKSLQFHHQTTNKYL